jgi:molybdopterin-synthase adenylyltransferase
MTRDNQEGRNQPLVASLHAPSGSSGPSEPSGPARAPRVLTIVGAGALGSHLALLLRSEDVSLRLIDFDRIEAHNLQSQFHGRSHLGKLKTEALKQTLQFMFGLKLASIPHRLTADNLGLLDGSDLIVDCLDNGPARRLVQGYARTHDRPCLHGALAADGVYGRVIWDPQFIVDDVPPGGGVTCAHGEFLPFIALTSAYLAIAAQRFLRDGRREGFAISRNGAIPL